MTHTANETRTRPGRVYRRAIAHRTVARQTATAAPATRGDSPSMTRLRVDVERLFRAPFRERDTLLTHVTQAIQTSRCPARCINVLVDEAVTRGGTDGLDLAAEVLARLSVPALEAAETFFRADAGRRADDRGLPHPRYRVSDEAWSVFLSGLARSPRASEYDVFALLSRAAAGATDGMREGIANAAVDLGRRAPQMRHHVRRLLDRMLHPRPTDPPVS